MFNFVLSTICNHLKKTLFLTPYPPNKAPSQRFRFEQYISFLKEKGHDYSFEPFLDSRTWSVLYKPENTIYKVIGILKGFIKRFFLLFNLSQFDYIFIHREAAPIGPPIFEWIIARVLRRKIIFDFDDAIWMKNTSSENKMVSLLKWHSKTASICTWSYKVSCGNEFLANYARQYISNVVINPTTVDTSELHIPELKPSNDIVIGWTGTHSTMKYLEYLIPLFEGLAKECKFILKVISNSPPTFDLPFLQYVEWSKETEVEQLNTFDIGIMPLTDDDWAKGKCGFKALQYMALEVPALVSPVGVNAEIVDHGVNGFHCRTENEWIEHLKFLIKSKDKRDEMGKLGRVKIIEKYSVEANKENFLSLFG